MAWEEERNLGRQSGGGRHSAGTTQRSTRDWWHWRGKVGDGSLQSTDWLMVRSLSLLFKAHLWWETQVQEGWIADFSRETRKDAGGGLPRAATGEGTRKEGAVPATFNDGAWAVGGERFLTRSHSKLATVHTVDFRTQKELIQLTVYNLYF